MPKDTDKLLEIAIKSMFECSSPFTKEELVAKIEEKDVNVKDIDILLHLFIQKEALKMVGDNLYQIHLDKAFQHFYGKAK